MLITTSSLTRETIKLAAAKASKEVGKESRKMTKVLKDRMIFQVWTRREGKEIDYLTSLAILSENLTASSIQHNRIQRHDW